MKKMSLYTLDCIFYLHFIPTSNILSRLFKDVLNILLYTWSCILNRHLKFHHDNIWYLTYTTIMRFVIDHFDFTLNHSWSDQIVIKT
jgi:hypothetical protein